MQPLSERERFAPTQPLPEYQKRLKTQRRWRRPAYTPNHVPLAARIVYGLISLTWVTWALIGLLSGHMFFLISRKGPIHFSGVPALLFSFAVMACAAACAVAIFDHYDRRDNEESYQKVRRLLWYGAFILFGLSVCVGLGERLGLLPYTDGRLGLLSTPRLISLLTSSWLAEKLAPHQSTINTWSLILFWWCIAGLSIVAKLSSIKRKHSPHPVATAFLFLFFMGPAVAAFALNLIASLASGSISSRPLTDEAMRAQVAWLQSMLLTSISMAFFLCCVAVVALLHIVGVLPSKAAH